MKIAFIGQKGVPAGSGGVEKHVEKLAQNLVSQGQEVFVYVRDHYTDPKLSEYQGVKLIHVPTIKTKHLDAITHTFFATLHALFQDFDVIHYHSIGPGLLSFIPRLFKPKARVIATFHTDDYNHKKWGGFARLCLRLGEYLTCTVPEKTIVISETMKKYATEKYRKEFVYIPNGADVEYEADSSFITERGFRPGRYVLSVSRLVGHKGIHYLIKAFRELVDTNKVPNNFKLAIVGSNAYTPEYERCLKTMSEGYPSIVFLGEQTGKNLNELFSHAAMFVQPSESEGLSLALLEAMGHGLLPIVSNIPANTEVVRGDCGAIFESKNVESLKKELAYYVNRPDEAKIIGRAARERIEQHYSWDAIARKTLDVYQDALKGSFKAVSVGMRRE